MYPLKLKPALKDYLWGGSKLKTEYQMESNLEKVAEAWVLSCHKDGQSVVLNGELAGKTLEEAINIFGKECLGTRGNQFAYFPILIKLIDAKDDLSVQVHPSDEYALKVEGEYGKTEMWYIVDAEPGATIYYGFKENITKAEFEARIKENTLTEVLNTAPVKKGDCFFINSGTIHAIRKGILIAEIQQNSNTTYRVSDYGRLGADGKLRPLHIEKAVDVTELTPPVTHETGDPNRLADCRYFKVDKHEINGSKELLVGDESFSSLLCLTGNAQVGNLTLTAGECIFLPAGIGKVEILGNAVIIESRV